MDSVTAIVVTRGDVDLKPVAASLPKAWELLVWNNARATAFENNHVIYMKDDDVRACRVNEPVFAAGDDEPATVLRWSPDGSFAMIPAADFSVYGRYAAIEYATNDLIYVQDDDVIVSDPQAIVDAWVEHQDAAIDAEVLDVEHVVCNMPPEFRPHYPDSALVGFGACFHRDAPTLAFDRFHEASFEFDWLFFNRCCDVVFTTLTDRVLVDVPKENREFAEGPDRMYRQPGHVGERTRMLELARMVRDA